MNKARMKNVALTLFVLLTLTMALIPMAKASVPPPPAIVLSPSAGPVPNDVTVYGTGFTPCGNVELWWDVDGKAGIDRSTDLQLGVAEANSAGAFAKVVTIPESFYGSHVLAAWDVATGQGPWIQYGYFVTSSLTLIPSCGPVGTPVTVEGTGFKANKYVDIYFNGIWQNESLANSVGSFTAYFNVPAIPCGKYPVEAKDRIVVCDVIAPFIVKPQIVLNPTQGPIGTVVTITGTGFDCCQPVYISFKHCGFPKTYWVTTGISTCVLGSFTYNFTIPTCVTIDGVCYPVCPGVYIIDAENTKFVITEAEAIADADPASLGFMGAYARAKFIVTPWFTIEPLTGPVGTEVTASGYGFGAGKTVSIFFKAVSENFLVATVGTDSKGNFETTFNVPEVVEGEYKVTADGVFATSKCCEVLSFEVIPWIWLNYYTGHVGDTVKVTGKGWDAFRNLGIIYGGIGNCVPSIPPECTICANMAIWWAWEEAPEGCKIMGILQPSGWAMVNVSYTNENGSFEVTFQVPESPGGYHPIYAGECLTTGWPYKMSANVPVFRVEPKIWIETHTSGSEGLSGEYVTLQGTGFSYVEAWFSITFGCRRPEFDMYFRVGTLVLDFDSNKQWIDEFNFIMNNEYSNGWQEMYWAWLKAILYHEGCPMFPEGYLPLYLDLNGTISHGYWWYWLWQSFYNMAGPFPEGVADMSYKGCPFLKVPVLEPGRKDVLAYYFGLEFSLSTSPEEVAFSSLASLPAEVDGLVAGLPTVLEKPMENPMGLLFGLDDCGLASVHLGKIYTDNATTCFTITKPEVETSSEEILSRLSQLEATVTGLVKDSEGNILAQIQTSVGTIQANLTALDAKITGLVTDSEGNILAQIQTSVGTIQANLTALDAKITGLVTDSEGQILAKIETSIGTIQNNLTALDAKITGLVTDSEGQILAKIETSIGTIQANLTTLGAKIVSLGDIGATVQTALGPVKASLDDLHAYVTVDQATKLAKIETDIGTLDGKLVSMEGKMATIETDVGTITTKTDLIVNHTGSIPITIALSLIAAIAAIAAAVLILRKVYIA
jgi:hypothetical protein